MCFGVCSVERVSGLGCWAYYFEGLFCFGGVGWEAEVVCFCFVFVLGVITNGPRDGGWGARSGIATIPTVEFYEANRAFTKMNSGWPGGAYDSISGGHQAVSGRKVGGGR